MAALAGLAVSLAGCQSFRDAAGLTKSSPDEFAVVTKPPLIIPPDFSLRPPKPGAAPTNQVGPTDAAEGAMFGSEPAVASVNGQLSTGEQEILAKAGATDATNMIRQKIAADNRAMQAADNSFTDRILFGLGSGSDDSQGKALDANAEAQRLNAAKAGGSAAAPAKKGDSGATIQKDDSSSGGWLDGIF